MPKPKRRDEGAKRIKKRSLEKTGTECWGGGVRSKRIEGYFDEIVAEGKGKAQDGRRDDGADQQGPKANSSFEAQRNGVTEEKGVTTKKGSVPINSIFGRKKGLYPGKGKEVSIAEQRERKADRRGGKDEAKKGTESGLH